MTQNLEADRLRRSVILEHLESHLRRMERLLQRRLDAGGLDHESTDEDETLALLERQIAQIERDAQEYQVALPLALLITRFHLSVIERDALVLAAAVEFDESCARLLARLRGGSRHGYLDPQLCLALFARGRQERIVASRLFESSAVLFQTGLLQARPLTGAPPYRAGACLTLPSHVRALLRGERAMSEELEPCARRLVPRPPPAAITGVATLVEELSLLLRGFARLSMRWDPITCTEGLDFGRGVVVALSGAPGTGRSMALRASAAAEGRPILEVDGQLIAAFDDWSYRLHLAFSEAELYGEVLHVRSADVLIKHQLAASAILSSLARRHAALLVLSHEGDQLHHSIEHEVLIRFKTPMQLVAGELERAWRAHLPLRCVLEPSIDLRQLADEGPLEGGHVRRAIRLAEVWASATRLPDEPARLERKHLYQAARAQLRRAPGALTTPEGARTTVELVLAEKTRLEIEQILSAAACHRKVMQDWGFSDLLSRGTGIICLFDGPPGTGKTLTAEIMARTLDVELHRINVSQVVDKYIGETEKNLARLFEQIIPERTLLLFDEADSLFGARVKVNTSNDRYSNMAVNTLLQLVEHYPGVVILTTNLTERIDTAFMRRITFKVKFEEPDDDLRVRLWRNHLPPQAPLADDVDLRELATSFKLAGGNIKNATLRAALAAAEAGVITQQILYEQACLEAEAMGMLVQHAHGGVSWETGLQ